MRFKQAFKGIGLAAAIMGLGAGMAIPSSSCGGGQPDGAGSGTSEGAQATVRPALPVLDERAPASFQTASFAFG